VKLLKCFEIPGRQPLNENRRTVEILLIRGRGRGFGTGCFETKAALYGPAANI